MPCKACFHASCAPPLEIELVMAIMAVPLHSKTRVVVLQGTP